MKGVVVFHSTTDKAAQLILADGFKNSAGSYLTDQSWTGVWISDRPLDGNEGAKGDTLLRIALDLTEAEIADYEWTEDGKGYREWLVPADLLNGRSSVQLVPEFHCPWCLVELE